MNQQGRVILQVWKHIITQPFDCVINIEGDSFEAHKTVLGAVSPFFYRLFQDQVLQGLQGYDINLIGLSSNDFSDILDYMYRDAEFQIDQSRLESIREVARLLEIDVSDDSVQIPKVVMSCEVLENSNTDYQSQIDDVEKISKSLHLESLISSSASIKENGPVKRVRKKRSAAKLPKQKCQYCSKMLSAPYLKKHEKICV